MSTALISVYNKDGIVEFARALITFGFKIISSGGTAKVLATAGVPVTDVAEISGLEPILDHRVATLVPQVHGGLLALEKHLGEIERLATRETNPIKIPWIDLVCVDFYPLQEEIRKPEATLESVIEKTDIGGPTMIRSGAKGNRIVICDPADRRYVLHWLEHGRPKAEEVINNLAAKAEGMIASYCLASAEYRSHGRIKGLIGELVSYCKYGENAPQQPAALYRLTGSNPDPLSLDKFEVIAGTAPSYINLTDIDRMLQTLTHLAAGMDVNHEPIPLMAVGVKHGNPCGASFGDDPKKVLKQMIAGDPLAIFGGWVMTNFLITDELAEVLLTHGVEEGQRRLLDGIVAPDFSQGAINLLKRKGDKCRFVINPALQNLNRDSLDATDRFRYVRGGFLHQPNYTFILNFCDINMKVYGDGASLGHQLSLLLASAVGVTSNSNTVDIVQGQMLIGNGVGQQDRVGAAQLALWKAFRQGHVTKGAVAYSDSFFPFPDGPQELINAGISAIFATSGSVNDKKTIEVCEQAGVTLYMLPDSQARGFFGH